MKYDCDYLIIGSGPGAAGVLDGLMSRNIEHRRIIILEAGIDYDSNVLIKEPQNTFDLEKYNYQKYFWNKIQGYQENVNLPNAKFTGGRLFGGGSSVNHMMYVRGSVGRFNKWYETTQDPLWHSDNIYRHYNRMETTRGLINRGKHGPLHIRMTSQDHIPSGNIKFCNAIKNAFPIFDINNDPNSGYSMGPFTTWQYFQKDNGQRVSSTNSIIRPLQKKYKNIKIYGRTQVIKILFNKNRAIGVECMYDNSIQRIYASQCVVICAGIHSSLILERSGIGNPNILNPLNIPVIVNLPMVGENLKNHMYLNILFSKNPADLPDPNLNNLYTFGAQLPENVLANDPTSTIHSQWVGKDSDAPDRCNLFIMQAEQYSTGYVHIQDNDISVPPLVSGNTLQDTRDIDFFKNIIRTRVVPVSQQLSAIDPLYQLLEPDPLQIEDDEYLTDYIRNNIYPAYHWHSQCEMQSVVNTHGRVCGTENLYIADGSVIPIQSVDANPSATIYVIGSIIGTLIKKKYNDDHDQCRCSNCSCSI